MKSRLLSKIADRQFEKLGFKKNHETDLNVSYHKYVKKYGYTHIIELSHRKYVPNIMLSYQKDVNKEGFNNVVGVSTGIMIASLLKMFAIGFNDKNKKGE